MTYPVRFDINNVNIEILHKFSELRNEDQFFELYKMIFERQFPKDLFTWYEKLNGENIWALAREKITDILIAIYGLMPLSFVIKGKEHKGYLCHNTGVIPKYQGKGLFQYLGEVTLNKILKDGELAIGFPNKFAVRGHQAIGWTEIGKMHFYSKRNFRKDKECRFENIHEVKTFPTDIDDFVLNSTNKLEFAVQRDHHFLNWRITKPNHEYRCFIYKINSSMKGYMVFKTYHDWQNNIKKGHIIDIMAENEDAFSVLINMAERISRSMNLDILNTWAFEKSYFVQTLINADFNKDTGSYDYSSLIYSPDGSIMNYFKQLNSEKIFLSLGDNDVF